MVLCRDERGAEKLPHRWLFIRIANRDAAEAQQTLDWGANPNWLSPIGRPALVRAVRGMCVHSDVVRVLLEAGADPSMRDQLDETALDRVRKRLARYQDRPRVPVRRSKSLTAGGELVLPKHEWRFIEKMEAEHAGFEELYLETRRKVAAKIFDPRSHLELAAALLENRTKG